MATTNRYSPTFSADAIPKELSEDIVRNFGTMSAHAPAQKPIDATVRNTDYKGRVVHANDDFVLQKLDSVQGKTTIVVHDRKALEGGVNPATGEVSSAAARLTGDKKLVGADLSISYDAAGKGQVFNLDRQAMALGLSKSEFLKNSGLSGKDQTKFAANLDASITKILSDRNEARQQAMEANKNRPVNTFGRESADAGMSR
jgi:hypothetical protein